MTAASETPTSLGSLLAAPAPSGSSRTIVACLALGLLLPLLAGGNVLVQLEPGIAMTLFLAAAALFSGFLLFERRPSGDRPSPSEWIPLTVLVALWCGNLLLRPSGPRAAVETLGVVAGALLFTTLSWKRLREEELERLVLGVAAGAVVTALYGQYQYWVMFPSIAPAMVAIYGQTPFLSVNANFYSANCYAPFLAATLVLLATHSLRRSGTLLRPLPALAIAFLSVTLVLTGSRATVALLLVAAFLLAGGAGWVRRQKPLPLALGGLAGALVLFFAAGWIDVGELWQTASVGRLRIWRAAMAMIRDHWLLGVGLGGFAEHFYAYRLDTYYTRYPHDLVLEVFAETGIVGALGLIAFVVAAFRVSWRAVSRGGSVLRRSAFAAAALLFTHALVDIDWHAPANPILFMVLLAVSRTPGQEMKC